jgi:holo-[acyl-carrier protein] synthase
MILGIGTDLCDIGRIEKALERFGERFAARILVESELRRFRQHRKGAAYLAKRFAAKEAFSKALGTGIRFPVNWHNVRVENARSGKPSLKFSRPLAAALKRRGIASVHLSITDEIGMACAFVVVEGRAVKRK